MTTGVGMEMSRERSALPRCHASSVLKCASTREASIWAIVSSCSEEKRVSFCRPSLDLDVHLLEGHGWALQWLLPYWLLFLVSPVGISSSPKWGLGLANFCSVLCAVGWACSVNVLSIQALLTSQVW